MTTTIGADPEKFVCRGSEIVSGIGLIGGSKEKPRPVLCGAVQEDNVLAEFNINPASTVKQFVNNINTVSKELDKILSKHGLKSKIQSSHNFKKEVLIEGGEQSMEFGCDPDYNCWTGEENEKPDSYTVLRTAGGHVHIGYDNPTKKRSYEIASTLEYLLGISSVLLDDDTERRELYGQAGSCRIKAYGVEYRVLSNFWLKSDKLKTWIFDMAMLSSTMTLDTLVECICPPEEAQRIINTSDKEAATLMVDKMINSIDGFKLP